jgi:tetratricopeptide (TPR) repeat protein
LHYLRGQALLRLERFPEARQALVRARDEDVCPLRALTGIREIVIQVAAQENATLLDFEQMVGQQDNRGIPGDDWFLDHVHPTIEGHRLLALELLARMRALGLVSPKVSWGPNAIDQITTRVKGGVDRRAHAMALRNLSKVLGWAGKLEQAGKLALLAVGDLPDDPVAQAIAAKTLWKLRGQLDEAVAHYQQAVRLKPEYFQANLELGDLLVDRGEIEASLEYYERAVQIKPRDANARLQLGNTLLDMGKQERAVEAYSATLRLDPQNVFAYRNLGAIARRNEKFDTAIAHYRKALELDPTPVSHCDLGFIFLQASRYDLAGDQFRRTIAKAPRHVPGYFGLGLVAEWRNDTSQARKMYERVVSLDPNNREARQKLAELLERE